MLRFRVIHDSKTWNIPKLARVSPPMLRMVQDKMSKVPSAVAYNPPENEHGNGTSPFLDKRYIFKWCFFHWPVSFRGCTTMWESASGYAGRFQFSARDPEEKWRRWLYGHIHYTYIMYICLSQDFSESEFCAGFLGSKYLPKRYLEH